MRAVLDCLCIRIKPTVAFDEPHAVHRPPADPVGPDEVRVVADCLRVLLQFRGEGALGQNIAEGAPDVSPAGFVGVGHIGDEALGGLGGISRGGRQMPGGIEGSADVAVPAVVTEIAHIADDDLVDVRDVFVVLVRDFSAQQRGHTVVRSTERERTRHGVAFFFL